MSEDISASGQNQRYRFEYASKVLCTANIPGTSQTTSSLLPGVYQTVVNVHNPNNETVRFRKKVAATITNQVSAFIEDELESDAALKIECDQIVRDFGPFIHGVEGFLVIQSTFSLDVVAVYTAGKRGGG